jgi:hypothetical protein
MKLFVSILISIMFSVILNAQQDVKGVTTVGNKAVSETVGDIMTRQILNETPRSVETEKEKEYPNRKNLPQNPSSQNVSSYSSDLKIRNTPNQVLSSAPITKGLSFTGGTLSGGGAYPPDNMGSIGPNQYIVAINSIITSYNKTTGVADGALNVTTDIFFQKVITSGGYTSDPHIRYDRLSKRWIFIIIDVPASSTVANRILIGVSQDSVITFNTVINFFYYQNSGNFIDYPTLGIDKNALYIGGNLFNYAGTSFLGTIGVVVQKSSIMGTGPMVATKFSLGTSSAGLYTPQGVDNLYDLNSTEGYFIGVDAAAYGILDLVRVTNPGSASPSVSSAVSITVPATSSPLTLYSKSCTYNLDADDERLFAAAIRNGHIWTAHHIETTNAGVGSTSGTRIGARWYDLINFTTGSTPALYQSGTVYSSSLTTTRDKNYAYPTIAVNGQGHSLMGFTSTGYYSYANAGFTYRLSTDPAGTMTVPDSTTASSTAYNPTGDGANASTTHRWGDYSMTECDPSDDMTFWTIQQFCNAANDYGCRVTQFKAPAPAPLLSATPNILSSDSNLTLVIKGDTTTTTGLGFYEPGVTFPKHLIASIDGGIIVNSVSYVSPGTVVLNVTTTAGTSGARTITITNPDGQVVSSGSIFTYQAVVGPLLAATPSALSGFSYIVGSGPTASRPFNLSGTNLTGYPGSITVTAPANYEVSLNDVNFAASQLVSYTSATLSSTTLHIRLKSGLSTGSYSGNVTNAGGGATTINVACSGTVNPVPTPILTVSPGSLSGFSYSTGAGPSTSQSYTLSGINLTPASGSITVQCLTNYEVSTNGTTFSSSVSPAYTGGTLSATLIYVRLKAGLTIGSYNSDTISNAGGGAVTQNVSCNGSVNDVTTLFTDDFNYTVGTFLTANGWAAHSGSGTNPPTVTTPGLSYSNYFGSGIGNAVTLSGNGEDDNHSFTSISSGSVYASAMIKVTSANATGDYFFHFGVGSTTTYNARVFVKSVTGGIVFGVCKTSTTANIQWSSTVLATGTTHFIVLKYTFVSGTTNDKAELFINPAVGGSEPASNLSAVITDADFSAIDRICLRQSSTTPVAVVDGIRVGQTWASVTPASVTTKTLFLSALIEGLFNGISMVSDTVTIELHNAISPYTLIESKKGVLNSEGGGSFSYTIAVDGIPYYLVIKHRNAVETWSSTPQTFVSSSLSYDFTTASSQAYGGNLKLKGVKYCLYSGDVNQDGGIDLTDLIATGNDNMNGTQGYYSNFQTDINEDGGVDLTDLIYVANNNLIGVGKVMPTVTSSAIPVNRPLKINKPH